MSASPATFDGALLRAPELQPEAILPRASRENFPVALRWLPRERRDALMAVYGFARLADQIGDAYSGDRRAALDALETELEAAFRGAARHRLLVDLEPWIERHDLPPGPFHRLIEANRLDQDLDEVANWEGLLDYCRLSANPVGELVLAIFGQATPASIVASDAVCTALQVVEHCQDVAEDARAGRIYLPADDRSWLGCGVADLVAPVASEPLRAVVAVQVRRARALLAEGAPLVASLHGPARLAVAAFVSGGIATCDALAAADFDPLRRPVRPRKGRIVRKAIALWLGGGVGTS